MSEEVIARCGRVVMVSQTVDTIDKYLALSGGQICLDMVKPDACSVVRGCTCSPEMYGVAETAALRYFHIGDAGCFVGDAEYVKNCRAITHNLNRTGQGASFAV